MISVSVNAKKTVTMVFSTTERFCSRFPPFSANGNNLLFGYLFQVSETYMIQHTLSDNSDVNRELKCLFVKRNLLNRCFDDARLKSNFGFLNRNILAMSCKVISYFVILAVFVPPFCCGYP